jgi:arsenite methyltransferase
VGDLRDEVRDRYAALARTVTDGSSCCGGSACDDDRYGAALYGADTAGLPQTAVTASLGCGNPTALAELRPGEVVLDLGSGGGIDAFLAAGKVGPEGKVFGLDMTDEMLDLARRNQEAVGATNVEFLRGLIEAIPLPAVSVDVIISNCVVNLSTDKPGVFAEMFRVLRPAGRIAISDIVAEDRLTPAERTQRGSYTGCIAGALSFAEFHAGLGTAGFTRIAVTPTHQVADGMHAATIIATRP